MHAYEFHFKIFLQCEAMSLKQIFKPAVLYIYISDIYVYTHMHTCLSCVGNVTDGQSEDLETKWDLSEVPSHSASNHNCLMWVSPKKCCTRNVLSKRFPYEDKISHDSEKTPSWNKIPPVNEQHPVSLPNSTNNFWPVSFFPSICLKFGLKMTRLHPSLGPRTYALVHSFSCDLGSAELLFSHQDWKTTTISWRRKTLGKVRKEIMESSGMDKMSVS